MKNLLFPFAILFITILFFYKTFFLFQIPFPGDLLVSEYAPWKYESFLNYNPGSYPNKAQYFDVIRQLYPWKILAMELIKKGEFPLWNPYNFAGSPLFANNQSSVLNPFNILFLVLKPSFAWSLYIVIQPLLASLFTYIYLRQLKFIREASLFGGIAFGFSLFMSTFLEYGNFGHTILWLPLILYLIEKFYKENRYYGLAIPVAVSFVFFAGHFQIATSVLGFSLFYSIVRCFGNLKKSIILITFFIIGIGLSAIQIMPTLELLGLSSRVAHPSIFINEQFLLQFNQLILIFAPDIFGNPATRSYILTDTYPGNAIYIGILPLIFTFLSFFKKKKDLVQVFFIISAGIFLILFVRNPISEFVFNQKIFSASSPSNFFFLLSFCLSVLGAFGFNYIKNISKKIILSVGITGLLFLVLIAINKFIKIEFYEKNLILGILIFIVSAGILIAYQFLNKRLIFYLMTVILTLDLFYYFTKFNPFVPDKLLYPQTNITSYLQNKQNYTRFIGNKAADIESNFSTYFKIFSPDGYDPLYPDSYNFYTQSKSRSDVKLTLENKKQLDGLGVKYVLDRVENGSDEKVFPIDKFARLESVGDWIVYENLNANPRAYVKQNSSKIPASIVYYSANKVELKIPNAAGILVLTDNFYPGWRVLVDGNERIIKKIDGIFRGVEVKEGENIVTFEYKPKSFYMGLILTIISIGSVGIYYILFKYIWKKL